MRTQKFWIIAGTAILLVLLVLGVGTGVVFANQQRQTRMLDDHVAACEEMHAQMRSDMSESMGDMDMQSVE